MSDVVITCTSIDCPERTGGECTAKYEIPMSLRTERSELKYQIDKAIGATLPLELEGSLQIFKHWRVINNRYPYAVAFKTHHMLVPTRAGVADRWDLNDDERAEFEQLLRDFVYPNYDLWFENCPKRRSVRGFYHVHLATYHDERGQMQL